MMITHLLMVKLGMLSMLLTLAGVILLVIWAAKNLSKNQLKHASLWLIGLGIGLGILASSGAFGMMNGGKWNMMMKPGTMMEEYDDDGLMMDEDEMMEGAGMMVR